MPPINAAYLEHQLKRWMRPDAHLFVHPNRRKFVRPGFEDGHPFALYERKYRPDQARDDHGRWTDEGGGGRRGGAPGSGANKIQVAQTGFGTLIAEIPLSRGRNCVYNFGSFSVVVRGPTNFHCMASVPLAATTHGQLLNDNRR